jgi:pimeloyl-ACP methyl ester carboxylesterase
MTGHPTETSPRRRRRWWLWVPLTLVLLLVVAVVGVSWYASGLVADGYRADQPESPNALRVVSADQRSIAYQVAEGEDPPQDSGFQSVRTEDGDFVLTGPEVQTQEGVSTRSVEQIVGQAPAAGDPARLDSWYYPKDPSSLGIAFTDVVVPGPLGDYPAWYIPGSGSTWMIFTHGRGADPREGLRQLSITESLGYPTLMISYRNDEGAPGTDGLVRFGQEEWPDLAAAVQYALDNGASDVILTGASTGGAISLALLENSPLADRVRALFFDSPALAMGSVVSYRGAEMGYPGIVLGLGKWLAQQRFDLDWDAMDYVSAIDEITMPALMLHSREDDTIPYEAVAPVYDQMAGNPDIEVRIVDDAEHVGIWNSYRDDYTTWLTDFLSEVGQAS